jgi:hypothetical protein
MARKKSMIKFKPFSLQELGRKIGKTNKIGITKKERPFSLQSFGNNLSKTNLMSLSNLIKKRKSLKKLV